MEIFNVQIFGSDKDYWLTQPIEWKVEWIRNHTLQQNDAAIEEFVNNPKISKDKICLTCGVDKHQEEVKLEEKEADIIMDKIATDFSEITGIKVLKKSRKK